MYNPAKTVHTMKESKQPLYWIQQVPGLPFPSDRLRQTNDKINTYPPLSALFMHTQMHVTGHFYLCGQRAKVRAHTGSYLLRCRYSFNNSSSI